MARRERNDVDYFPHRVNHGQKMFYLRSKFNNDGYAVWFMLLEKLGRSDYHYLNLQNKVQIMYLSSEFLVSEETLLGIINILVEFSEFDQELWHNHSILYNENFVDSVQDAYKKRSNDCIDKNGLLVLLKDKGILNTSLGNPYSTITELKVPASTQSKVKYSKVKNTIDYYREFAHLKISPEEHQKLIDMGYSKLQIDDVYDSIENYKKNKVYTSLFLTAKNWLIKRYPEIHQLKKPSQQDDFLDQL